MPGVIVQQFGPLTYLVDVQGRLWKRHVDHLKEYHAQRPMSVRGPEVDMDTDYSSAPASAPTLPAVSTPPPEIPTETPPTNTVPNPPTATTASPRYPTRHQDPPVRYDRQTW